MLEAGVGSGGDEPGAMRGAALIWGAAVVALATVPWWWIAFKFHEFDWAALTGLTALGLGAAAVPQRTVAQTDTSLKQTLGSLERLGSVTVGSERVPSPSDQHYQPSHRLTANFDNRIELMGYDLAPDALTLYWRARARLYDDYTVFVQAFDAQQRMIAQSDSQPLAGDFPTSYWRVGDVIRDEHRWHLSDDGAQILIGLYQLQTGERLRLADSGDDALRLR